MTGGLYDPDNIALETSLGYYLSKARQALGERMDRALEPLDLTSQQIGVILLLARGYARTPFELSRKLSYDSGSMTRMLDRLERKGFVSRARSEQDRRVIELTLTERGADAAHALPALIANALNAQLAGFSADELVLLTGMLQRFIANGPDTPACPSGTTHASDGDAEG
ncbi:MarR family winged helix-turn-helix transcriptional regulator [Burkholderia guangdongensis]|uniref:MarR family winged helix-turn-helix transcriptional regulator n=1 Tax=Burkholderia guangdongensis TaxID=1792500 RepID=UPI0015CC365D|nr:MarR family transcriptional regulator [Burkholderia guangdongensis]